MIKEFFKCPECGDPLSMYVTKDNVGNFKFEFFCEGGGDDKFSFQIITGLNNKDVAKLEIGRIIKEK